MRLHRFYIDKPLGEEIVVENVDSGKELIHQWTHVFRYTSGDEVFLFSNSQPGTDHLYTITTVEKNRITLAPRSTTANILTDHEIILVMALVKKDTFETIVRQATELGVSRIIPLAASRSEKKNLNFERLLAIAREAAEQSGRGMVPVISQIMNPGEAFQATIGKRNIAGSLQGSPLSNAVNENLALWIGPEGGWTEGEEEEFRTRNFTLMKLTDTVLKADTAAVALLSRLVSIPG